MRRTHLLVLLSLLASMLSALPSAGSTVAASVHVVRFSDRISDTSRAALESAGVRILAYEPPDGYLVWGTHRETEAAERLAVVESVAPVPATRKLSPALSSVASPAVVDVTVYQPVLERTRDRLASLGEVLGAGAAGSDGIHATLQVRLPRAALLEAARLPAVLAVGPSSGGPFFDDEKTTQITAGNIEPNSNQPIRGYRKWLTEQGLDGDGVKVAIVDTGISPLHPDFGDRVERPAAYTVGGQSWDPQGHGTHVAGVVGGDPPDPPAADADGFVYGLGVAPAARLVDMNTGVFTLALTEGGRMDSLSRDAWATGARMWNGSWHTGVVHRAGYTATTRAIDVLARDADLTAPGSEQFLFVFSAGNTGDAGPFEPHEAKNIVTVGSTGSGRAEHAPGYGTGEGDIDAVSSFSSRGPTADGRIFPLVTAPGGAVVSARAPEKVLHLSGTNCLPPMDAVGLYATCSGTSMAAPHVAGASALLHQWWKRETGGLPSPAMVKALLVNRAADVGDDPIPNNEEGWGRVDLREIVHRMPEIWNDQETVFGGPGEAISWVVDTDGSAPLTATLSWTDAPAAVGANPTLVNDLDLTVERLDDPTGERWLGNVFAGGRSRVGGMADRLHNLENIFLADPRPGRYRITARAQNIPGDGIPWNEDATDQDFALVVRGASPGPVEPPSVGVSIQPGASIRGTGGVCSLNWIYDRMVEGPDGEEQVEGVYAGAGTCAGDVGDEVTLVEGVPPQEVGVIGEVAFRAPPAAGAYVFVRLEEEILGSVDPTLRGYPGIPTGLSTTETAEQGDEIAYVGRHPAAEEENEGVLNFTDGVRLGLIAPIPPGSGSGGPIANLADGKMALGNFAAYNAYDDPPHAGPAGWALEGILADARNRGWDMRLRTVLSP